MKQLRQFLTLVLGLAVGAVGAVMFLQSMPPEKGSADERAAKLEVELKRANNRITTLEASDPHGSRKPGRTLRDGARGIVEDLKDGKPVSPDDILRAMQPFLRDFSPIFERLRAVQEQRTVDSMAGEMARKYSLTPAQQESLQEWLDQKADENSKRYTALITREGASFMDIAKAGNEFRLDDGLDEFMAKSLRGEKLAAFKHERLLEKIDRVQQEADMKVSRLDAMVQLDETQRGQIFGVMARGARDFDPTMQFEGLGTDTAPLASGKSKRDAIMSVLTPEQRQSYQEQREQQWTETRADMARIGLAPPTEWENIDELDY